jgi:hypothetical protein
MAEKFLFGHKINPPGRAAHQQYRVNEVNMIGYHNERALRGHILLPVNFPGERNPEEEFDNG